MSHEERRTVIKAQIARAVEAATKELRAAWADTALHISVEHGQGRISGLTLIHQDQREALARFAEALTADTQGSQVVAKPKAP